MGNYVPKAYLLNLKCLECNDVFQHIYQNRQLQKAPSKNVILISSKLFPRIKVWSQRTVLQRNKPFDGATMKSQPQKITKEAELETSSLKTM